MQAAAGRVVLLRVAVRCVFALSPANSYQAWFPGSLGDTTRAAHRGEQGQALAEEALILVLIGVVAMGALAALGVNIADALVEPTRALTRLGTETPDPRNR
jgi:hypothetical protein